MTTLAEALGRAASTLADAGVDTPRLDAEVLLARAAGFSRASLLARLPDALDDDAASRFGELVERRRRREPVAYIEGGREFWSLWFELDRHTLVPRPETELLVETAVGRLATATAPRILEVGTGSGCIAVALASELRDARITALDTCAGALAVARRNARRHGVADRIDLVCADLRRFASRRRFDLIVSNPPYARRGDIPRLMPEIARWEPARALDGGDDGLEMIRALLASAAEWLLPTGLLAIEIGSDQAAEALALADAAGLDAEILDDLARLPRLLLVRLR